MERRSDSTGLGLKRLLGGVFALALSACRRDAGGPASGMPAAQVIQAHAESLMAIPGVVGVYEGRSRGGRTVIRVMLAARADSTLRRIPRRLEGYPVEIEAGGPIEPMRR